MTKHTPGPWNPIAAFNARHFFVRAENEVVAQVYDKAANARLIAAAPDLLDALRTIEAAFAFGGLTADHVEAISAAIAKAEGRDQ